MCEVDLSDNGLAQRREDGCDVLGPEPIIAEVKRLHMRIEHKAARERPRAALAQSVVAERHLRRLLRCSQVEELLAEAGQTVDENEVVAVIETDKVSLDVRASRSGVVSAVLVSVGDEVKEKQPLFTLEE